MGTATLKKRVGVLLRDWPLFEWRLRHNPLAICNRREQLEFSPGKEGARCGWQWTSDLHACRVFPLLGRRLMQRMLTEWPVAFSASPPPGMMNGAAPSVSFIIGHRGLSRRDHLLATLGTIAAQRGVSCECLVIEQSVRPEVAEFLPAWVRYRHTPLPCPDLPYSRSWAFNVGARLARGELLILHDNDLLAPRDYAAQAWRRFREGFEVINLKRFIFYLTEEATSHVTAQSGPTLEASAPASVMQNAEGGGSIAVGRSAYLSLGGFDETFLGWGGEDVEFWQRGETRPVWSYGALPLVHLRHPPQPGKVEKSWGNQQLLAERSAIPAPGRVRELALRNFGDPEQLVFLPAFKEGASAAQPLR